MSSATISRSVAEPLVIVALAVTVWAAVAQAGPTPMPIPPVPTGSVVGWGSDYLYRYDYPPEYTGQATPPDSVNGVSGTATDVAAGGEHSCAIQAGTDYIVSTRIKCFE